jgi:hypothetical protein
MSSRPTSSRRWALTSLGGFFLVAVVALVGFAGFGPLDAGGEEPALWSPARPGQVLLVGDSLLHQSRHDVDRRFESLGVETAWIGGPGEGLLTEQSVWLDQIDHAVETFDPDAVVIEACCNYAQADDDELYVDAAGVPVPRDSPAMYELWEEAGREAVARAGARGATVSVVLAPPPVEGTFFSLIVGQRMERFAAIWREIAADTPEVHLIDWTPAFSDGDTLVTVLPGLGRVRHDDGLHVVGYGHELVASLTAEGVLAAYDEARAER